MATNRCAKHGVFSGRVGCPWCKQTASRAVEDDSGVKVLNSAGTGRTGATIVSKATSKDVPGVEVRVVGHDVMSRTKRIADEH